MLEEMSSLYSQRSSTTTVPVLALAFQLLLSPWRFVRWKIPLVYDGHFMLSFKMLIKSKK